MRFAAMFSSFARSAMSAAIRRCRDPDVVFSSGAKKSPLSFTVAAKSTIAPVDVVGAGVAAPPGDEEGGAVCTAVEVGVAVVALPCLAVVAGGVMMAVVDAVPLVMEPTEDGIAVVLLAGVDVVPAPDAVVLLP